MPKGVQGSGPGGGAGADGGPPSALEPLQEVLALIAKAGTYPDAPIEMLSQFQAQLTQAVRAMHGQPPGGAPGGGAPPMGPGGPGPGGMPPGGGASLPPELLQALSQAGGGLGGPGGGAGGGVPGVPPSAPQLQNPDELKRLASMPQGAPN